MRWRERAAAAWPLATGVQVPQKTARICYIGSNRDNPIFVSASRAFLDELQRSGFIEGHKLLLNIARPSRIFRR